MGKRNAALASMAVLSVLASACSSSGAVDDSSAPPGAPAGSASSSAGGSSSSVSNGSASLTGTPVKVGMICSCTGPFGATIDSSGKVADAWAKSVNESGGLNGHPVELERRDDASNPGTSVTVLKELIDLKVDVILDLSPFDSTWAKEVSAAKIPVVGGELSSAPYGTNPNFYASGTTPESVGAALAAVAKRAGATSLADFYAAESASGLEGVAPFKEAGEKLGLPFVYKAAISGTQPNYTAECLAAKQAGATAILVGHSATVIARVAADCQKQEFAPIILEAGTGFTMKLTTEPGTKDRLWIEFPILPFVADAPAVKAMNTALDKYYPGLRTNVDTWSTFAAQAWTAGLLIGVAVNAGAPASSDPLSAEVVTSGLNSLKDQTLDGWAPGLTFAAGEPHPVRCWFTARVQNGKVDVLNDGKPSCQSDS